ncbi:MAG: DUF2333 family protein [Pseudomonadota bacterium]
MSSQEKRTQRYKGFILILFIALIVFVIVVMAINSTRPAVIQLTDLDRKVKGAHFTKINQALLKQMSDNWLPNDIFWPTIFLDNMPNFQIGELEVVRYNIRVLRDNLSRMRTTDKLDPYAEAVFTSLSNDPFKWWFPSAESKWKLGHENLELYYRNLLSNKSYFYPRADNLVELLSQYASLMGGVNTRLLNAPRDIKEILSIEGLKKGSTGSPRVIEIDIPWYRVDDNFYYAQGVAYALNESLKAIKIDFLDVLIDKNSVQLLDKIMENLGRCHFEPLIVFNGDPDSIFANHSLNLSGVFNDARLKIDSLIVALMQG